LNYTEKPPPSPENWLNIENKAFNEPKFLVEKDTFFFIFPRFFQKILIFAIPKKAGRYSGVFGKAEVAHLVEHDLAKVGVAGSSPVFRSNGKSL
jgi:hypothetical protein